MKIVHLLELRDGSGQLAFEWDSGKAEANFRKHGLRFEEAVTIFEEDVLTIEDTAAYSELREVSYGWLSGARSGSAVVICVVHTDREDRVRIISARKATAQERKHFDAYFRRTLH